METNTLTNSTPQTRRPRLLLSLFCAALAYTIAIWISLTVRSLGPGILLQVFALWSFATGNICLVIVFGFYTTDPQTVRILRAILRPLVAQQINYAAIVFLQELCALLHLDIFEELVHAIGFIAMMLAISAYTYVCATTPAASRDEGFNIVTILERWMVDALTSCRNDDQPAASTEATPLRKLYAEANTGNFQTRLSHMFQNLIYHRQLPAQIDSDSEKGSRLEGPEVV